MPELTPNVKIMLGIIAASTALLTGMLGNVLAANISAFLSGTPTKTGRRPVALWVAFFITAALSVLAGSYATFAPTAPPTATVTPTGTAATATIVMPTGNPAGRPQIVVTNVRAAQLQIDTRSGFVVCRDTVEVANTSDIATSVVAVGMSLHLDNTLVQIQPTETSATWSNSKYALIIHVWRNGPPSKDYSNLRSLDRFSYVRGDAMPLKVDARSTAAVVIDFAVQGTSGLPTKITATHSLRFPDIADVGTQAVECK